MLPHWQPQMLRHKTPVGRFQTLPANKSTKLYGLQSQKAAFCLPPDASCHNVEHSVEQQHNKLQRAEAACRHHATRTKEQATAAAQCTSLHTYSSNMTSQFQLEPGTITLHHTGRCSCSQHSWHPLCLQVETCHGIFKLWSPQYLTNQIINLRSQSL